MVIASMRLQIQLHTTDEIKELNAPENVTDLKSLLGLSHYSTKLVPSSAGILSPLNEIPQKHLAFNIARNEKELWQRKPFQKKSLLRRCRQWYTKKGDARWIQMLLLFTYQLYNCWKNLIEQWNQVLISLTNLCRAVTRLDAIKISCGCLGSVPTTTALCTIRFPQSASTTASLSWYWNYRMAPEDLCNGV